MNLISVCKTQRQIQLEISPILRIPTKDKWFSDYFSLSLGLVKVRKVQSLQIVKARVGFSSTRKGHAAVANGALSLLSFVDSIDCR